MLRRLRLIHPWAMNRPNLNILVGDWPITKYLQITRFCTLLIHPHFSRKVRTGVTWWTTFSELSDPSRPRPRARPTLWRGALPSTDNLTTIHRKFGELNYIQFGLVAIHKIIICCYIFGDLHRLQISCLLDEYFFSDS